MISDRVLKAEMRRALDETLPPAPWLESQIAEELRRKRPLAVARRGPWGLSTRTLQVAAALLIVAIGVAAFVALHQPAPTQPAGSLTVHGYQALIARDANRWSMSAVAGYECLDLQSPCEAPGHPVLKALQDWLNDLSAVTPPDRFVVIDAQMKRHLAAAVADMNALFAAHRAQDQNAFDRAGDALSPQMTWLTDVPDSIVASTQATVADYMAGLRSELPAGGVCADCQPLIANTDSNCSQIQMPSCQVDVGQAAATIGSYQSNLARHAAPTSLASRDAQLQLDLARADTGLLDMSNAGLTNDQAGFDAGRALLQRALPAVDADIAAILGS